MNKYIHIIYFTITALYVIFIIKPNNFYRFMSILLLSSAVLFVTDMYLISLKVYQFYPSIPNIYGVPLFHILWGGLSGTVFMHYFIKFHNHRLLTIVLFTCLVVGLEKMVELAGMAQHLGTFNDAHEFIHDFFILTGLAWLVEWLVYKEREC